MSVGPGMMGLGLVSRTGREEQSLSRELIDVYEGALP